MPQPDNTTLIQVGFMEQLNYVFVANHQNSTNQIFAWLPLGIAYGLGIDAENCTMHALQPYDTQQQGYITTLALAYIPTDFVSSLALDLHTPSHKIYHNPNGSVNALMNLVNPSIPLLAGPNGNEANGVGPPGGPGNTGRDGEMGGNNSGGSPVRGSSVGIGVGVVCGAAVYGVAMFYVARRYRRRKQAHARTSSIHQDMSPATPGSWGEAAMMAGGRTGMGGRYTDRRSSETTSDSRTTGGRTARTGPISRPVMAENSLGFS